MHLIKPILSIFFPKLALLPKKSISTISLSFVAGARFGALALLDDFKICDKLARVFQVSTLKTMDGYCQQYAPTCAGLTIYISRGAPCRIYYILIILYYILRKMSTLFFKFSKKFFTHFFLLKYIFWKDFTGYHRHKKTNNTFLLNRLPIKWFIYI